jgi:hypothetical protein
MKNVERLGMYFTIVVLMLIITAFFVAGAYEALRQMTLIQ